MYIYIAPGAAILAAAALGIHATLSKVPKRRLDDLRDAVIYRGNDWNKAQIAEYDGYGTAEQTAAALAAYKLAQSEVPQ